MDYYGGRVLREYEVPARHSKLRDATGRSLNMSTDQSPSASDKQGHPKREKTMSIPTGMYGKPATAPVAVHPRSVIGAVIFSFFIPGTGSMYGGKVGRGIAFLVSFMLAVGVAFAWSTADAANWASVSSTIYSIDGSNAGAQPTDPVVVVLSLIAAALFIGSLVSAFRCVQRWNREHGITS